MYVLYFQDSDIHITYDDQQKINRFARLNAKLEETKDELKLKQRGNTIIRIVNYLKNMKEADDELDLVDDSEQVPYMFGEVLLLQSPEATKTNLYFKNDTLTEAKEKTGQEIKELESTGNELKEAMSELRTQLYAKFGNNINLEAEED
ncbi:hypothetical protein B566_EDAN005953 [Ephemera danica]|nr:hypothetical protein B566_EDAN005953 [Ephemera danica]